MHAVTEKIQRRTDMSVPMRRVLRAMGAGPVTFVRWGLWKGPNGERVSSSTLNALEFRGYVIPQPETAQGSVPRPRVVSPKGLEWMSTQGDQ